MAFSSAALGVPPGNALIAQPPPVIHAREAFAESGCGGWSCAYAAMSRA